MLKVFINNKLYNIENKYSNLTILQLCENLGIQIPRFCYHEKLSIAGNCRMCLVEINKSSKPVASCAMPIADNIHIFLNSILIKKARESILEFLLANHPLDCPICDQGGECDLQDETIVFGSDRGRFYEYKRTVKDKNFGPLIKTIMTRCIHCTRCIRFITEIAGISQLGSTGRGYSIEIGNYIQKVLNSEISANIIDLCPVGALTSKPYAFVARSWELKIFESIDILDNLLPDISINIRGNKIIRILPRLNYNLNEEWISDKTRFAFDGLLKQRLLFPLIKMPLNNLFFNINYSNNYYLSISWESLYLWLIFILKFLYNRINFYYFIGNLNSLESIYFFKKFINNFGLISKLINSYINTINIDFRELYIMNLNLNLIKKKKYFFFINLNLRLESPVFNTRFLDIYKSKQTNFFSIGIPFNLTYKIKNISNNILILKNILEGKHYFSILLNNYLNDFFILINSLTILNISNLNNYLKNKFLNNYFIFNSLNNNIFKFDLNLIDNLNFKYFKSYDSKYLKSSFKNNIIYFLNSDDFIFKNNLQNLIIYQGHHGDEIAKIANLILPIYSYIEKSENFVNIQGIYRKTTLILQNNFLQELDSYIFNALILLNLNNNILINKNIIYNYISKILIENQNLIYFKEFQNYFINKIILNNLNFKNLIFKNLIDNFYFTDVISRSSKIMSLSTKELLKNNNWINI
jgi:NADH-quinone oxidoreductase subunit G